MPKILHTARYTGKPLEMMMAAAPDGFSVKTLDEPTYECLCREAVDADYLLVSGRLPIDEGVLSAAKKLKMIQRTGVGLDMLDRDAVKRRGIPVYVNAGVNARSVAEHALTLMLDCLKNIPEISAAVKRGVWEKQRTGIGCNEMFGKTVGLVGMGAVGRRVAGLLSAFGCKVVYTDVVRLPEADELRLGVSFAPSFAAMLPQVDILSFHCPLTPENRGMLDAGAIESMKNGASVVNTARGQLIDEDALYDALRSGKLRSAALDVHCEEPLVGGGKFAGCDNVILTPHIAGLTCEAFAAMLQEAFSNIVSFEKGTLEKKAVLP